MQTHITVWAYDSTLETYTRFDVVTAGIVLVIVFMGGSRRVALVCTGVSEESTPSIFRETTAADLEKQGS